jgi:hypothetical protein
MTIQGTSGCRFDNLESQVSSALQYIRDNICSRQVLDPANTNNSLSDDISSIDKQRISWLAQDAIAAPNWTNVFSR